MRLTTIWTLPGLALAERLNRTRQVLEMRAAELIPKRIKYWAYIQVGSKAMRPDEIVPDAKFVDLLQRAEGAPE